MDGEGQKEGEGSLPDEQSVEQSVEPADDAAKGDQEGETATLLDEGDVAETTRTEATADGDETSRTEPTADGAETSRSEAIADGAETVQPEQTDANIERESASALVPGDDGASSRAENPDATPHPDEAVEGETESRAMGRESSEMEISGGAADVRPTPQEEPTVSDLQEQGDGNPPAESVEGNLSPEDVDDNDDDKMTHATKVNVRRSSLKKLASQEASKSTTKAKSIQFKDDEPAEPEAVQQPPVEKPRSVEVTSQELHRLSQEMPIVEEEVDNLHALSLVWGFGLTPSLPVLNLTTSDQSKIFYSCAHIGILYDYAHHRQQLLQAHRNSISCSAASVNRRWLVTADKGPSNTLVIWDTHSAMPIRTILEPHPNDGTAAVAISSDNKFVASMSAGRPQVLAIWDWLDETANVLVAARLDLNHYEQTLLTFRPNDSFQLLSNSDSQVLFYEWNKAKQTIGYYAPVVDDTMVNRPIGKFTKTEFLRGATEQKALTATTTGNLIVWECVEGLGQRSTAAKPIIPSSYANKKVTKILKVTDKCVDVLTAVNGYVITGDSSGVIKFLENDLKMKNWFYELNIGPIRSVSFDFDPKFTYEPSEALGLKQYTRDATIPARLFPIPSFVAASTTGIVARFNAPGSDTKILLRMQDSRVHAIAAHPKEPLLAICGYNGYIQMVDYRRKRVMYSTMLALSSGVAVRCCTFDPMGYLLALGLTNGEVVLLTSSSLCPAVEKPLVSSAVAILHIAFSHDASFLATADQQFTTTLFAHGIIDGENPQERWIYYGRYRAHYKPIQDLLFGINIDTGRPRLLTLGVDRFLVEYDLDESTEDHLALLRRDRIEQSAIPMCISWYPPITKENFILTANSQFKLKLFNASTKKCRYTYLGPAYGSPLQKIVPLPAELATQPNRRYLAYITRDMLGLSVMPLDGNPHKSVSLLAHPRQIVDFCASNDGVHIFTCGGPDPVVHMWRVNVLPLDAQAHLAGGDTIEPFYRLLDGGRQGAFVREMEDFFYYLQIKSQGIGDMGPRVVGDTIPLDEVPNLMRALGFYPTEQEIENMIDEVKYGKCIESPDCATVDRINLDDFLRLYINHRPAFGLDPEQILWAFRTLASNGMTITEGEAEENLSRGELFALVQNKGEHMTEYELGDVLVSLLGYNVEDECGEKVGMDAETISQLIDESLPEMMTSNHFVDNLLGLATQQVVGSGEKTGLQPEVTTIARRPTEQRGLTTEQTLLSEMTIPELQHSGTMTD